LQGLRVSGKSTNQINAPLNKLIIKKKHSPSDIYTFLVDFVRRNSIEKQVHKSVRSVIIHPDTLISH
jgi:hypothetical protein